MAAYILNFVVSIFINNYRSINKIYRHDEDKRRAIRSIPVTAIYIILLFAGMVITMGIFEVKGIENNSAPAVKLSGLLILGALIATIGFLGENNQIKKWNPTETKYKINKISIASILICMIVYGTMCII